MDYKIKEYLQGMIINNYNYYYYYQNEYRFLINNFNVPITLPCFFFNFDISFLNNQMKSGD